LNDDGPGIEPEHIPRLTERFYRAENKSGSTAKGTGLGLAIVKHIINRHHGILAFDSTPGQGMKVSISFRR
jgi:two-component system phosphate regulon sensor histidine kinase PhoR